MQEQIFLMSANDGIRWLPDRLLTGNPVPAIRKALDGRWKFSKKYGEFAEAFFGERNKRVLLLKCKPGFTMAEAEQALALIAATK